MRMGILDLLLILGGKKAKRFSSLNVMLVVDFLYMTFIILRYISSILNLRAFIKKTW